MKNHADQPNLGHGGVISPPSANTNPMHKSAPRAKSLIIRQCENKHCNARYEVTEVFQSHKLCPHCRKPAVCVHKVKTTERCTDCFSKHRSWFMRTM